jgi:hypothetical protein
MWSRQLQQPTAAGTPLLATVMLKWSVVVMSIFWATITTLGVSNGVRAAHVGRNARFENLYYRRREE